MCVKKVVCIAAHILFYTLTSCVTKKPLIDESKSINNSVTIIGETSYLIDYDNRITYLEDIIPGALTAGYALAAIKSNDEITNNELYIGAGILIGSYILVKGIINKTKRSDFNVPVDSAGFSDWFIAFNKINGNRFTIVDTAFYKNSWAPVIADQSYLQTYKNLSKANNITLPFFPIKYLPYSPLTTTTNQWGFTEKYYLTELKHGIHIPVESNSFEVTFSVSQQKSELLNNYTNAIYYRKKEDQFPSAVYVGNFKNGLPNGLGVISYKDSTLGYRRTYRGLFSDGEYIYKNVAYQNINDFLKSDLAKNYYKLPNIDSIEIDLISSNFQQDYIDDSLFNEYQFISKLTWKDGVGISRYLLFRLDRADFYTKPEFTFLNGDKESIKIWQGYKKERESGFADKFIDFILTADDYYYDNNTYVSRSSWWGYGYNSCGGKGDGLFSSYNEDASRDITIYTRLNEISKWEKVGMWKVFRTCESELLDEWIYTTNVNADSIDLKSAIIDATFNIGFESEQEALNEIIEHSLANVKYPKNRKTIEQRNNYNDAMYTILKRAELSGIYDLDTSNIKIGVWQTPNAEETLFIGNNGRLIIIATEMIAILNEESYINESVIYNIVNYTDNELTIQNLKTTEMKSEYLKFSIIDQNQIKVGNFAQPFHRINFQLNQIFLPNK